MRIPVSQSAMLRDWEVTDMTFTTTEIGPVALGRPDSTVVLYSTDHPEYPFVVASSVPTTPFGGGPETMVFAADENGEVIDWTDLACVTEQNIPAAIERFDQFLNGERLASMYDMDDAEAARRLGDDPFAAIFALLGSELGLGGTPDEDDDWF